MLNSSPRAADSGHVVVFSVTVAAYEVERSAAAAKIVDFMMEDVKLWLRKKRSNQGT